MVLFSLFCPIVFVNISLILFSDACIGVFIWRMFFLILLFFYLKNLKNKAISLIKLKEVLNELGKITNVHIRDSKFITIDGFLNLHPARGTHWTLYINEYCLNSYGCPPPNSLKNYLIEKSG